MSARSHHPIGSLVLTDPRRAARELSAVLERHGGAIPETAAELGVNGATLRRWIAKLRGRRGCRVSPVRSRGKPADSGSEGQGVAAP